MAPRRGHGRCRGHGPGRERGQASVELVGIVFTIVVVALLSIQGITVAQTASIAQEAARNGARALSLGQDWQAVVERTVPEGLDLREAHPVVADGAARVRVTVAAPLGLAGMELVDVSLTRTAVFPVEE
jgi:hypothetical protein